MTKGKTVLITGAGTGIARALALRGAELGFNVIIAGRTHDTLAQTIASAERGSIRAVVADVTTSSGRAAICDAVGGSLEYLFNNAGTLSVGHLSHMTDEDFTRMAATNLVAPMALTRDLLPALRHAQGRVVNIGSVFGDIAYPFFAGYSATKFGLRGFSDALRRELSGTGIGVTYVAPRATQTTAKTAFDVLIEPLGMTLDSAETVAAQTWAAALKGRRGSFPKGKERLFVKIQRLFPRLIDTSVGAQARHPKTRAALDATPRA